MRLDKYPNLSDAATHILPCVQYLRAHPTCEFEARFGLLTSNKFTAGVKREFMCRIIEMFEKSNYVTGNTEWIEEQDFFFTHQGQSYRTRVCYDTDTMEVSSHTILKTSVYTKNIALRDSLHVQIPDIRVALKTEDTMKLECIPQSVKPDTVRIKQRRRFTTHDGTWAFDFSMTWAGNSKTNAEKQQMNEEPIFEVECELLEVDKYLTSHTDEYVAVSILLKMQDLLEKTTVQMVPV